MQKKNIKLSSRQSTEETKETKGTENKRQIRPLGDRVLIWPFTEEALRISQGKKPSFDIILPESLTKEKSAQGKVLAVGEGKWLEGKLVPVRVKVGDTVVFSKYGYDEVEQNGEELYLLKEENILAVIK
jgi:chaperonin GroES